MPPATPAAELEVRVERSDDAAGRRLLAEFRADIAALYGALDDSRWPSADPGEMAPPGGVFLVLYDGADAVACGGVKQLEPGLGEVKRMHVAQGARSRGYARRLLAELERAARELGHERVRLDTGPEQPHALALYESAGYLPVPDYNANLYAAYWFEKRLA